MGALRLIRAMHGQESSGKPPKKELIFVNFFDAQWKGHSSAQDSKTIDNFIAEAKAKRFGLKLEKDMRKIKVVNFEAHPISMVAKAVMIAVGSCKGTTNFTVMTIDNFKVILGIDFLASSKAVLMLHLKALSIMEEASLCMVLVSRVEPMVTYTLSAL